MHYGSTSVPNLLFGRTTGARATLMRVGLASAFACAFVTGALAQGTQGSRSKQQLQAQGLRQAPGRLVIPITGTIESPAVTPTVPATPSTSPTTTALPPTSPSEPPATPSTDTPTEPTTPTTPTAPVDNGAVTDVIGSFSIQRFARTTDGGVAAVGTLTVTLTDPASGMARTIVTQVAMPVTRPGGATTSSSPGDGTLPSDTTLAAASRVTSQATVATSAQACETLSLTLAGIQLDLLGIAIQLDQVNVDFTVAPGTSARLSGVLCGVTGVIDGGASPAERTNSLNSLLETIG